MKMGEGRSVEEHPDAGCFVAVALSDINWLVARTMIANGEE